MIRFFTLFCSAFFFFSGFSGKAQNYRKFSTTNQTSSFTPGTNQKFQLLYLPGDFDNTPPTYVVDDISFRRTGSPNVSVINNFTIKLGSVDATSFPGGNQFFTDLTTVFSKTQYEINEGGTSSIIDIDIDDKFTYQAGKTMVVEISYTSATTSMSTNFSTSSKRLNGAINSSTGTSSTSWLDFGWNPKSFDFTPPPNDLCTNAQLLLLNQDCQTQVGNTVAANQTNPPAFCGGFPSSSANDVYYRFVASTANDSILVKGTGGFDPVVQLYSGTCGSLTAGVCSYTPGNAQPEKIAPGNLVPGQTYFIRVYGFNGIDGGFTICGRSGSPTPPANDNCANASTLTLSTVCASVMGTTAGATQELAPIPCFGNTSSSANEVWYKFDAQNTYDSVVVISDGFINPVVELYSGGCGNLNTISCSDNASNPLEREKVFSGSLTPGTTYYLRVYGFGTSSGSFTVCAKTPPLNPPANDDACNGIVLVLNDDCLPQTYSNVGATQNLPPSVCQPGGLSAAAADVWFQFPYTSPFDSVVVSPIGGFNPVVELYSSFISCVGISPYKCSDGIDPGATESISTGGTSANTIYVRVYGFNGTTGSFNICLRRGDPSVLYDNCANALLLNVSQTTCDSKRGRTIYATPTAGLAACKGNPDDDVWYRFDPFGAANLAFRLRCDPGFDGAMQIFSGSCGSLTQIACINRMGAGFQEDTLMNFTSNTLMYYIRVYHVGAGPGQGGFSLCVNVNQNPSNDNCTNGTLLSSGANLCSPINSSSFGAAQANAPIFCNGRTSSTARDVWYYFSATSSTMEIYVKPVGGMDPVIQLFSGNCFNLTDRACKDDSLAGQGERLIATGLNVGTFYNFRVYSFAQPAAFGDFSVCIKNTSICNTTPGTASSNISNTGTNGRVILNLAGQSPGATVQWQISTNGGTSYANIGQANASLPDTFNLSASNSQNQLFRAVVTSGNCIPANSNAVTVFVRCGTPFANPVSASSGTYISNVSFNSLNNNSTPQWANGAFEDFSSQSTSLCKGIAYPLFITSQPMAASLYRAVWADLNNDGDFSDANELLLAPTAAQGQSNHSVQIPVSATVVGTVKMRVMVFDPGTANPSANPCFSGTYASGEIEEYNLSLSNPVVANAGSDRVVCSTVSGFLATNPSPGTGLWTRISGTGTVANPTSPTSSVSGLSYSPNVFIWTVTNQACSDADTVILIPEANPIDLPEDTTACDDDTILLASPTQFPIFLWSNGSAAPIFPIQNSGLYWLMVTTQSGCTFMDTIVVTMVPCTSVDGPEKAAEVFLLPNPAFSELRVLGIKPESDFSIRNAEGRQVLQGKYTETISIGHFPAGLYLIELPESGRRLRFMKQ